MAYIEFNENPDKKRVGDCVVRAIATAAQKSWERVYLDLAIEGLCLHDMPTANRVWGSYLRRIGWERCALPNACPDCYTVAEFAADNPNGVFIVAADSHAVCVANGDWFDTWNSGEVIPLYYWKRG